MAQGEVTVPALGTQPPGPQETPTPSRAHPTSAQKGPLTGRQVLGSKSGQVMLETEEMSWLLTFTQLKKVQLFLGSLFMSPGCGAEDGR